VNFGSHSIPFVKATACGNDFLLIDRAVAPVDISDLSRRICDRHSGVGADGVEWISPHSSADVEIHLINADGSSAEISGNGTRCVAAYVCATQAKEYIAIVTGAGTKTCNLISRRESEYEFEMAMGKPTVGVELGLKIESADVCGIPVSLGNPHYVVFVAQFAANWQERAANIQRQPNFPEGVNVEFVIPRGRHHIEVRFFERGAGETQSSGTGSCASAVAAMATGRADSPVRVHAAGGVQTVRREEDHVFLKGTARLLCRGEFFLS
jgi:diaminopimelate epimerase